MSVELPKVIGVLGAGTMGRGIAQVAAAAGCQVMLFDSNYTAVQKAQAAIAAGLAWRVERGKLQAEEAKLISERVQSARALADLAPCMLVIEAIVEDARAKAACFSSLEDIVSAQAILATNTSSLPLEQIASDLRIPERFAGMHFFNPPAAMKLVEIISSSATARATAGLLAECARAWGKQPIHAISSPGFVVNRVSRPFYTEPLQMLEQGYASADSIDDCLTSAGFPMGPFALIDLIGVDVNAAVTASIHAELADAARFIPSKLQGKMVEDGKLGRKSGQGFYAYDPTATRSSSRSAGVQQEQKDSAWLRQLASADPMHIGEVGIVHAADSPSLTSVSDPVAVVDYVPNWLVAHDVAIAFNTSCTEKMRVAVFARFADAGICLHQVGFQPGLIVLRTVACLINCARDALAGRVATRADIDLGMRIGLNHPHGPFAWEALIGSAKIDSVLAALQAKLAAARYEPVKLSQDQEQAAA